MKPGLLVRKRSVEPRAPAPRPNDATTVSGHRRSRWRKDRVLIGLAAPGFLAVVLFNYVPLLGNVVAFQDFQPYLGVAGSQFIGFDNFDIIISGDAEFLNALRNTLVITFIQVVLVFPLPICLALLLNSLMNDRVKVLVQSVLYLPHFLSWVIVVALFQNMFGATGQFNSILAATGLPGVTIMGVPELFKAVITSQVIWKDTGWSAIIYLAALSRVDTNLYEAAALDRAGPWQRLWHVTLPAIRPVIILLLILKLGDALSVGFEQILLQQAPVGTSVSEVLDTYVYNNGIVGQNWGVAAAIGLVKGIVGVILVLAANRVAHVFGERGVYQR
ncbi:ABC transporter permease [Jiangella endophytica]|uniref:ABC transporter permease n=1 Tax=Jiangella endophytica TaxID=1623398 RepID=UPI000E341AB4|nr:ABC transporter permease subunit [Jiangella endophytica]